MPLTERGHWSSSTVTERGKRVFTNLTEQAQVVFGVSGGGSNGAIYTVSLFDSISSSESFTKLVSYSLFNSISLTENFNKSSAIHKNESLSLFDSASRFMGLNRIDNITLSDSISKSLTIAITDAISITGNENKTFSTSFVDTLSSSDTTSANGGKAISLSDAVTIIDSISKALTIERNDIVSTGDSDSQTINQQLFDAITQTDTIIKVQNKTIILNDNLTSIDSIAKALGRVQVDTLSLIDNIGRSINVNLYDVIVTSDEISKHLPNAPTLIGTILLKGSRELNVYLVGSRELNVTLKGGLPMAEINQNIEIYAGETKSVEIIATNKSDSTAINLNGATIKWAMRLNSPTHLTKDTTSGITITDATNGKFTVNFVKADTVSLTGNYYHEARVIDANGDESVVTIGTVKVLPSYTN